MAYQIERLIVRDLMQIRQQEDELRRKMIKIFERNNRKEMAEEEPRESAKIAFKRPAYCTGEENETQAARLIREQGEQIEHKTVEEYIAEKYSIREVGQNSPD